MAKEDLEVQMSETMKWMATDSDGEVYLYPTEPFLELFPHNGNPNEYSWDYIGIKGCEFIGSIGKTLTKEECLASLVKIETPFKIVR